MRFQLESLRLKHSTLKIPFNVYFASVERLRHYAQYTLNLNPSLTEITFRVSKYKHYTFVRNKYTKDFTYDKLLNNEWFTRPMSKGSIKFKSTYLKQRHPSNIILLVKGYTLDNLSICKAPRNYWNIITHYDDHLCTVKNLKDGLNFAHLFESLYDWQSKLYDEKEFHVEVKKSFILPISLEDVPYLLNNLHRYHIDSFIYRTNKFTYFHYNQNNRSK